VHKNFYVLFLVTSIFLSCLSGCYDAIEIDDQVYAVSVGVDKGVNNKLRLTVQYPTYKGDTSGSSGGGQDQSTKQNKVVQEGSNVQTVEAPTMLEAIDMLSMAVSRRVSLIHAKWLIFSEDFAKLDVSGYMGGLERFRETRTTMAIIVTKGKAEDFIKENQSNIGSNLSKSVELLMAQSKSAGFFPQIMFSEFYRNLLSTHKQPIALYAGVNDFENLEEKDVTEPPLVVGKGFLPGQLPRRGAEKRELVGIALFNGGKMIGALDSYETTYYMMLTGNFKGGRVSIPDKHSPEHAIVFDLHNSRKPRVKAYFKDGKPVIDLKISMETEIYAIQSRTDYEKLANIRDIETQIEEFLFKGMSNTINKTQKQYGVDIFGFGGWMAGNFFTIDEWENYNWLSHFKEASINLDLKVNVRRTGLIFNSAPFFTNEGKEDGTTRK
jgi:spore germination protein KC